jgi:hypothetical protein
MLHGKHVEKIPGGKLLKLELDYDCGIISSLSIRGDFFAHPEDGFDRVEESLRDITLDDLEAAMTTALECEGVTLYGISSGDVAQAARRIIDGFTTAENRA